MVRMHSRKREGAFLLFFSWKIPVAIKGLQKIGQKYLTTQFLKEKTENLIARFESLTPVDRSPHDDCRGQGGDT